MTDELLYERLAISIANTHSPLPHVHGEAVSNINQLYPLLIAPAFRHLMIVDGVRSGTHRERVRHELRRCPCVPARSTADLESDPALRRRRGDRHRALDHALVIPPDRGRGLSGVRLGAARHPGLGRAAGGSKRPARSGGDRPRRARTHAVLRTRSRLACSRDRRRARRAKAQGCAPRAHDAHLRVRVRGRLRAGARHQRARTAGDVRTDRQRATRCRLRSSSPRPPTLRSSLSRVGCCRFSWAGRGPLPTSCARRHARRVRSRG